jgi:hypothetical protein
VKRIESRNHTKHDHDRWKTEGDRAQRTAFGRFPWGRIGFPPAAGAVTGLGILVLLVIFYDLVSLHRIHRSTMWAGPFIFASVALAVPIGMTPAWHAFAAMNRTIGPHI